MKLSALFIETLDRVQKMLEENLPIRDGTWSTPHKFPRPQNREWEMAGRPRLPNEVAKITGAEAKNAGRFKGRASPKVKSLGLPPVKFCEARAAIWEEFNADFPWLGRSDRRLVGLAVELQYMIDTEPQPVAVFAQMRLLLSSMGGTPVDRSKVGTPDEDDEDPADKFFAN